MNERPLAAVVVRELPVGLFDRSRQHLEALMREFAIIAEGSEQPDVPRRLLQLVEHLRARFGTFTGVVEEQIDAAGARGDTTIDLEYRLPLEAADAAVELGRMLDEADEYCLQGDLLTLAAPPQVRAFREWYLGEVVRQLRGEPAQAWSEWSARERA